MKTGLLQLLKRNVYITRDSLSLKIKKRKNLNTFKGPVAPNLRREEDTRQKINIFHKKVEKSSEIYGNKDEN
jgi:hypothetical protein